MDVRHVRHDPMQQKAIVERAFAGETSWKIPELLDAMRDSTDLYFDDVTQIHLPHWSKGRVAVLGDAGYAPTLITGQGTSSAVVGAYVLAGELTTADSDHRIAFDRYQQLIRSYVEQNQGLAQSGELSIPNSWEELEQKSARMREVYDSPDAEPAEDCRGWSGMATRRPHCHASPHSRSARPPGQRRAIPSSPTPNRAGGSVARQPTLTTSGLLQKVNGGLSPFVAHYRPSTVDSTQSQAHNEHIGSGASSVPSHRTPRDRKVVRAIDGRVGHLLSRPFRRAHCGTSESRSPA